MEFSILFGGVFKLNFMNFDVLHDHIDQNYYLGSFVGPRDRSKLIFPKLTLLRSFMGINDKFWFSVLYLVCYDTLVPIINSLPSGDLFVEGCQIFQFLCYFKFYVFFCINLIFMSNLSQHMLFD